jgi:hypothetical protein
MRNHWRIQDNGRVPAGPGDIDIFVDGVNIAPSVRSYTVSHDSGGFARLTVEVGSLVEISVIGDTEPRWHGLERVPSAALRAELALRDDLEPEPETPDLTALDSPEADQGPQEEQT